MKRMKTLSVVALVALLISIIVISCTSPPENKEDLKAKKTKFEPIQQKDFFGIYSLKINQTSVTNFENSDYN